MSLNEKDLERMVDKYSKAYNDCDTDRLRLISMWDRLKAYVANKSSSDGLKMVLVNSFACEILSEMKRLEMEDKNR